MNDSLKINFNSSKAPTQEQFNEYHKTPVDYGEDGDQMLGMQYTKEQAAELFTKNWIEQTGEAPDFDILSSIIEVDAGWTKDPEDGGYCFCWVRQSRVKRRYTGWLLWM